MKFDFDILHVYDKFGWREGVLAEPLIHIAVRILKFPVFLLLLSTESRCLIFAVLGAGFQIGWWKEEK